MSVLNIVFSCDQTYIEPLITIINSIITNTSKKNRLRFNIVCDDVEQFLNKLQILEKTHNQGDFTFNCVSLQESLEEKEFQFLIKYSYSNQAHTNSIFNFSRFWFGEIFPELDYMIYLDIDMIIEGDIFELSKFEFNDDKFMAAVLGSISGQCKFKIMNFSDKILRQYGANDQSTAFNAGLYVTSLVYWKKHKILDQLKNLMTKRYIDKDIYKLGTQPPLNLIFYQKILDIDDKNWMVATLGQNKIHPCSIKSIKEKKAKCLHWTGSNKPWNKSHYHEIYSKYSL